MESKPFEKKRNKQPSPLFFSFSTPSPIKTSPQSPVKKKFKSLVGSHFFEEENLSSPATSSAGSEIDDCIKSLDGSRTLTTLDFETREVYDQDTKSHYFVSCNGELFYNRQLWHQESLRSSIELSVCGGNLYALLMGGKQPVYFTGRSEDELSPLYYRVASKVNFVAEGEAIFSLNKKIKGFIYSLVISYFLGDYDISNVVAVEDAQDLTVVRIDPEFSFSSYFSNPFYNQYEKVFKELNFILQPQTTDNISNFYFADGVDFFRHCFVHKMLRSNDFLQLFLSSVRISETKQALKAITETPFAGFAKIIERDISNDQIREALKDSLRERLQHFKRFYNECLAEVSHSQTFTFVK